MSKTQKNGKLIFAWKKAYVLPAFLLVIVATTITAHAYLKWSAVVENTFTAEESVNPIVNETFADNLKTNVKVNPGRTEYSVYVRAAIVATWVNNAGEIHANVPVPGVDYELDLNATDWFEKDGFYYHKAAVVSAGETKALINSCKPLKAAPLDKETPDNIYKLKVDIVTQTIQAAGMTDDKTNSIPAVTAAWGVTVNNSDKTLDFK